MSKPDIRQDLMTHEQFESNCMHYADFGLYIPPDQFLFRHYDEPNVYQCQRGMVGGNFAGDKYFVFGHNTPYRQYYGAHETKDVTYYLKSGTWIEVPSEEFFATAKVAERRAQLEEAEQELQLIKSRTTTPEAKNG